MRRTQATGAVRFLAAVSAGLALAALSGCGDSTKATISGKVSYKNAPVTGGSITLTPSSGSGNYAIFIKPDGSFLTTDVPPGQYKVAVSTDSVPAAGEPPPPGNSSPPAGLDPSASLGKRVAIPPKYNNANTSNITWDIKSGRNDKPLDLTD